MSLSLIFLTSLGILKPPSVQAAENGPAGKIMLRAASGPKAGQVTLTWVDVDSADNYHLVYGISSTQMQYGALNIGKSNVYTVEKLNPATKYYFALVPVMNNMAMYTSEWVSAWPASPGQGGAMGGGQMNSMSTAKVSQSMGQPVAMMPVSSIPMAGPVGKHWLVARTGPNEAAVTLNWRHVDDANNYHLVYGTEHGKFKYGALNIGWVTKYTVKKLTPGVTYHFALVPVKNDVALYTTDQVMMAAKMNIEVVQTTPQAVMQPKVVMPVTDTSVVPDTIVTIEPTSASSQ